LLFRVVLGLRGRLGLQVGVVLGLRGRLLENGFRREVFLQGGWYFCFLVWQNHLLVDYTTLGVYIAMTGRRWFSLGFRLAKLYITIIVPVRPR
jgi:hypothetical protein